MYIDGNIYHGTPENERGAREMQVYRRLNELGIEFDRIDHDPTNTMEACAEVKGMFGIPIYKNLLLTNRKKTEYFLVTMMGDKRLSTSAISALFGFGRLSFTDAETMERLINTHPGSVSVLGLMFDKECAVHYCVDLDIAKSEYWGAHPCENTSSLKIKTKDILKKFLPSIRHSYIVADMSDENHYVLMENPK